MQNTRNERQNAYGTSRDQILVAAEKLFATHGYKSTTLKDVAKLSGANTALVGYHFGNKEGLRNAVIERQLALLKDHLDGALSCKNEDMTMERFREVTSRFLDLAKHQEVFYRTCLWSLVDGGEFSEVVAKSLLAPIIHRVSKYLHCMSPKHSEEECLANAILYLGMLHHYANMHWHYFKQVGFSGDKERILQAYENQVMNRLNDLVLRGESLTV